MFSIISGLVLALIIIPLIAALPTISIDVPGVVNGSVYSYFRAAAYFLPMSTVGVILTISLSLFVLRMLIAIIKAVREILLI